MCRRSETADPRREVLLVGLGEGPAVEPDQPRRALLAVRRPAAPRRGPRPRCGWRRPAGAPAPSASTSGQRLRRPAPGPRSAAGPAPTPRPASCSRRSRPAKAVAQDLLHPQPDRGVVAVARDVDEAGHEAAVVVAAQEQPGPPALLQVHHGRRRLVEVVDADLEQLVARVGLQDGQQVLAGVAGRREAGARQDVGDLAADAPARRGRSRCRPWR